MIQINRLFHIVLSGIQSPCELVIETTETGGTNANSAAQKPDGPTFDMILKLRHQAMIMEHKISQLQERVNVLEDFHGKNPEHFVPMVI